MELIDKNDLIKRMSIGAPMNWTDSERELGEESQYKSDMLHIRCSQEVPAIPIPKGATNGDMIKALFPDADISLNDSCFEGVVNRYGFDEKWWNAPYKKE